MAKSKNVRYLGFYTPHDPVEFSGEVVDRHTGLVVRPPSMTKQEFRDECDIQNILKQFKATGIVNHISSKAAQGAYMDLPDNLDFQDAMNTVLQAQEAFATLPSKVRGRFQNDPEQFLAFMADPANKAEAAALGLLKTPPVGGVQGGNPPPADASPKAPEGA